MCDPNQNGTQGRSSVTITKETRPGKPENLSPEFEELLSAVKDWNFDDPGDIEMAITQVLHRATKIIEKACRDAIVTNSYIKRRYIYQEDQEDYQEVTGETTGGV